MSSENEASVKIVADASGVAPAVAETKGEIAELGPALERLTVSFAEMAAEMRASMSSTAAATAEMAAGLRVVETETEKESLSLKEMAAAAIEAGEAVVAMEEMFTGIGEILLAIFAVEAVADWAKEFAEAAEHIQHLGEQFGMTTQQVQGLGVEAKLAGIPMDTLVKGMGVLDKNLFSGAKDSIFKQLGIDAKAAKDQVDLLAQVADKFQGMDDGPKKAALAMELFGRAGKEMIPILNQGGDAMREAKEKAEEYGAAYTSLSDDAQTKGVALAESINETGVAWTGVTNVLGDTFGPALKEITDSINTMIKAFVDSYTEGGTVAVVFATISAVVETVGAAINALVDVFSVMWEAVVEVVGDLVSDIMDAFGVKMPASFKAGEVALNLVKDAFVILKDLVVNVVVVMKTAIMGLIDTLVMLGKIAFDAFNLNWGKIGADWQNGLDTIKAHALKNAQEIENTYQDLAKTIAAAMSGKAQATGKTGIAEGEHKGAGGDFDPDLAKPKKEKAPKDDLVQQLEDELTQRKVAWDLMQDQQDTAQQFSLQSEKDFWDKARELTDLSTKDRLAINEKYLAASKAVRNQEIADQMLSYKRDEEAAGKNADDKLAVVKKETAYLLAEYGAQSTQYKAALDRQVDAENKAKDQKLEIAKATAEGMIKLAEMRIAGEEADAKFLVQMGVKTQAQLLGDERASENQRYAAEAQAMQQRLALMKQDKSRDPVAFEKLNADIRALETQHQQKMTQIDQKAVLQRTAIERQGITSLSSSWSQTFGKLVTLQQGFATSVKQLWQGLQSAIGNALASIAEQWLVNHISKLVLGAAASKSAGAGEISTAAAIAGANGVASMALAPFPLDTTAPEFGGAMAAAAAGFGSMLTVPSLSGGSLRTSEGLTMIHEDEAVIPAWGAGGLRNMISAFATGFSLPTFEPVPQFSLPAGLANPLRSIVSTPVANNNAPPAANQGGGHTFNGPVIMGNLHAIDTQSGVDFLMKNQRHVAAAGAAAHRNGFKLK